MHVGMYVGMHVRTYTVCVYIDVHVAMTGLICLSSVSILHSSGLIGHEMELKRVLFVTILNRINPIPDTCILK